ncbi:MAG: aminotransferase class IV [Opitutaceae bacterium]|jgi:branched-chain amino acid aminotransferase|nr:aminotransferase class IV [Opitutaceae bacterium]
MSAVPFIQANTNGRLHRADEPSVSPLNRGFLYGDAIYEVWRTYHGVVFAWDEHWARLLRSAAALYFTLPFDKEQILEEIKKTAGAYRQAAGYSGELYIRLQVSRGAGAIGLDPALADRAEYTLMVQPCPQLSPAHLDGGQWLTVATSLRRNAPDTLNPAWKTGNYLNNLLCLREARSRGADEVVILNQAGEITEAAVCNLGFIRAGEMLTPPSRAGILEGITRGLVIGEVAARAGLRVREVSIRPEELSGMEEAFLLSTTKDIQPVRAIDAHSYRVGPDTLSRRLKTAFADYAHEQAERWRADRSA